MRMLGRRDFDEFEWRAFLRGVLVRTANEDGRAFSQQDTGKSVKPGHGFCVAGTRISPEVWVSDFAMLVLWKWL